MNSPLTRFLRFFLSPPVFYTCYRTHAAASRAVNPTTTVILLPRKVSWAPPRSKLLGQGLIVLCVPVLLDTRGPPPLNSTTTTNNWSNVRAKALATVKVVNAPATMDSGVKVAVDLPARTIAPDTVHVKV